MALRFTKHAMEKLGVRQIDFETIKEVLANPQHRFHDTLRNSEVAARGIMLKEKP